MSDMYGYIGIETLLNFCENSVDHAVTPNDFMRMPRVRMPEKKKGKWIGKYPVTSACSECNYLIHDSKVKVFAYCPNCGAYMKEGTT